MSPVCSKHVNYPSPRNSYYCAYQPHASTSSSKLSAGETDPSNSNPSDSESVIDRIKRRSFYCRFNEKKPKRASTIVGPAAREYYRDMATKQPVAMASTKSQSTAPTTLSERGESCSRSKSATPINSKDSDSSSSYKHSSYMNSIGNSHSHLPTYHHRHYHSTPVPHNSSSSSSSKLRHENDDSGTSDYKALSSSSRLACKANDYLNLRNTLTSPTSSAPRNKSYSTTVPSLSSDYLLNGTGSRSSNRSSLYEHTGASTTTPFLYASASYNPKRRTSSYITPSSSSSSSLIGGHSTIPDHSIGRTSYTTLNQPRKPRAYDHRSISLLDPKAITSCGLLADRKNTIEPHQLGWWSNH